MADKQDLKKAKEGAKWLRGADLSEAHLSRANLNGANLNGANLNGANLSGADISRANLSGADISRANLNGANLSGANLRGANLIAADLSGANLRGVKGLPSRDEELGYIRAIKEEIISKGRLDQRRWHFIDGVPSSSSLEGIDPQTLLQCSATHSAAGSAQLLAVLAGRNEFSSMPAPVAGSMLVPSLAVAFFHSTEEMIKRIDGILSGEIPLLDR